MEDLCRLVAAWTKDLRLQVFLRRSNPSAANFLPPLFAFGTPGVGMWAEILAGPTEADPVAIDKPACDVLTYESRFRRSVKFTVDCVHWYTDQIRITKACRMALSY